MGPKVQTSRRAGKPDSGSDFAATSTVPALASHLALNCCRTGMFNVEKANGCRARPAEATLSTGAGLIQVLAAGERLLSMKTEVSETERGAPTTISSFSTA